MRWITSGVEFGPADRLRGLIERALRGRIPAEGQARLRILDIGSGGAAYWKTLLATWGDRISLTLLDPMEPSNLSELLDLGDVRHFKGFAPKDLSQFDPDSFDICVAFDLIEHLNKEDGFLLLYHIDRITIGASVIFTPNGFVWQAPSENNPFNAHISGWRPSEFRAIGWKNQRGHAGLRFLFGPYGLPKRGSSPFRQLAYLSALVVKRLPSLSFAFSSVRVHSPYRGDVHSGVGGLVSPP